MTKRSLVAATVALGSARALAQPVKDPFAPVGSDAPAGRDATGTTTTTTSPEAVADGIPAGCEHVTQQVCRSSNTSQLVTSGAYVVASVVVFSIVRMWWNKKGTSTIGVRLLVTMGLAAAAAGVLVALDPVRGKDLACCFATPVFRNEVWLAASAPGRVAVLGVVPAMVLFFIVTLVEGVMRKR